MSALIAAFIALFVYRAGSYFLNPAAAEEIPPVNVKVSPAQIETIYESSPITGRIEPVEDVAVVPLAQGRVTEVLVSVGDEVSEGQVLFRIDSSQAAAAAEQARAAYEASYSAYSRMQVLYAEGAVSAQDMEAAKAQYEAAAGAYAQAGEALSNYSVTSPIDGYVTGLSVSAGSIAGGAMAASVANVDSLVIKAGVSEKLAAKIELGSEAEVYIASLEKSFRGTVSSFSRIPTLGTLTYPLTVTMEESDELLAGMFAEVRLVSGSAEDAVCVASEAVIIKNGAAAVCVLDDNDIPEFRQVSVGIDNGVRAQILSGVEAGERVVFSGQQFVEEGVRVKVSQEGGED